MKDSLLYYSVGALLYCPANSKTIARSILTERFGRKYSLALCLEDTIRDGCVKDAERQLAASLRTIYKEAETVRISHNEKEDGLYLPKIFVRVRCPGQIPTLYGQTGTAAELLTGFIAPKFSLENADSYIQALTDLNHKAPKTIYMMPILESPSIIHLQDRAPVLYALKEKLDAAAPYILNIRVGGNDLCSMFGFRRQDTESIYGITPIAGILSDIITVFGMDYIVSGPVWEYYNSKNWDTGLSRELAQDRLCGFVGKTVIHPKQIPLVNAAYQVSAADFEDAKSILHWEENTDTLVSGSVLKERMNEYKTHCTWAEKILFLAKYYGVAPHYGLTPHHGVTPPSP